MNTIACPRCKAAMENDGSLAGCNVCCPACGFAFTMPGIAAMGLPPVASSFQQPAAISTASESPIASVYSSTVARRFKESTSWLDLFDYKFEKYLTPRIIRASWVIWLTTALLLAGIFAWDGLRIWLPESPVRAVEPQGNWEMSGPTVKLTGKALQDDRVVASLGSAVRICIVILATLYVRLICEAAIVIYNIAMSLASIDKKTRG